MTEETFDYIIVGAGSAGCVLANRLSENADNRVLLLEAGGWDRDPWIQIPLGFGKLVQHQLHDWGYFGEPEPHINGRRIECARGKVIGGSSSTNAMAHVRGHRSDFDRWAQSGLPAWSYANVLPYFRRQESWEKGEDTYRGDKGPLTIQSSKFRDPLHDAYFKAAAEAGYPATSDYNGAQQEGFGVPQSTIRGGKRCSTAVAYLRPALSRRNLRVITNALAHRVVLQNCRAKSLRYSVGNDGRIVHANREIILCAGVFNSPQILMLSGVGDPNELQRHGIPIEVARTGVGKNLRDHLNAAVRFSRNKPGPFHRNLRFDRIAFAVLQAYFFGTGAATIIPSGVAAFIKTDPAQPAPDTQLMFVAGAVTGKPYFAPFVKPFEDTFASIAILLRPESSGHVSLGGPDPRTPITLLWNFLSKDSDRLAIRRSFKAMRSLHQQPALKPFIKAEIMPGPNVNTDDEIDAFIRSYAITSHHPLGTCRMGTADDPLAVVDQELRVYGVEGLRVADAAVMPDMVGGNTNASVIMIAEKAADMIRGKTTPEPAHV